MTPKEKANELENKFYQGNVTDYNKKEHLKEIKRAKKRAKICVKEIIRNIEGKRKDYWNSVLEEIDSF